MNGLASHYPFGFRLFFLSGFSVLFPQVVWMRELSLLFGATARAAAAKTRSMRIFRSRFGAQAPKG
jgi:hypothetical protein